MTTERAIEILNPEHREQYDSIETVNEACRMGMAALEKDIPKKPLNQTEEYNGTYGYCPCCNKPLYDIENLKRCKGCGQALDWSKNKNNLAAGKE